MYQITIKLDRHSIHFISSNTPYMIDWVTKHKWLFTTFCRWKAFLCSRILIHIPYARIERARYATHDAKHSDENHAQAVGTGYRTAWFCLWRVARYAHFIWNTMRKVVDYCILTRYITWCGYLMRHIVNTSIMRMRCDMACVFRVCKGRYGMHMHRVVASGVHFIGCRIRTWIRVECHTSWKPLSFLNHQTKPTLFEDQTAIVWRSGTPGPSSRKGMTVFFRSAEGRSPGNTRA